MTGEHHVGMQLNLWHHAPAPCLDVCREDNEGDESRVGKQRPRHPLKVGDDSPCLWVTACPILLFFPPTCCLCHHHNRVRGIEAQIRGLGGSPGSVCVPREQGVSSAPDSALEGEQEPWEAVPSACPCSHSVLSMTLFWSTQFHVGVYLPGWCLSAESVWEGVLAGTSTTQGDSRMARRAF